MTDTPTKADLVERIEELEDRVQEPGSMDPREWLQSLPTTTRRNVIRAALGMAGVAALSGTASAANNTTVGDGDPTCEWLGDQSAEGYSLANLDELGVNEALVRQCLGAPVYASDSDAPNGTVFFNSSSSELKYKDANGNVFSNAGGGGGALSDSGTDTDGGDDYQLPNSADNIDLQGDGAIQDADSVETDKLFNDDEPAVDRISPLWNALTESSLLRFDKWHSRDGFRESVASGGSFQQTGIFALVKAGSTGGAFTQAFWRSYMNDEFDWSSKRAMRFRVLFAGEPSTMGAILGCGRPDATDGFGFRMDGSGNLVGSTFSNGSVVASTGTLATPSSSNHLDLSCVFTPGQSVDFYVEDRATIGGTVSTGVPSAGDKNAHDLLYFDVTSNSTNNTFYRVAKAYAGVLP